MQRLLEALEGFPAYAISPDWAISGWNAAYAALYRDLSRVPAADRNFLWLIFTDPCVREKTPDWERVSRSYLAQFRAEAGPRLCHPSYARLVKRLLEVSAEFRAGWENHDIEGFSSRVRLLRHPVVGDLHLEQHRLAPSDHPRLRLLIYRPVLTTDATEWLRQLLATNTPNLQSPIDGREKR